MKKKLWHYSIGLTLGALLSCSPAHAVTNTADIQNAQQSVQITEQASTPATPATGKQKIYFKTDSYLYRLDDAGTETLIQDALPITDSTAIVKGSSDATKLYKIEVDGLTTGTTRTLTVPDEDVNLGTLKTKIDGIETSADVTDATNVDAAGAVMESDFNANTILYATSDDTPAALTITEGTLLGRLTGGNIAALTESSVKQLLNLDNVSNVKNNLTATGAPGVSDDTTQGYSVGSIWIDVANDVSYLCQDASTGAAVWTNITAGASGGDPDQNLFSVISGDTGTDPTADTVADTLTVTGGDGIRVDGNSTTDAITISACDDDGDTCVKTEESADEDKIRFDTGGTQRAVIDSNGLALATGENVTGISDDTLMTSDSADLLPTQHAAKTYADSTAPTNYIGGLNISNNGTDGDHDIDIAKGVARDVTDVATMRLTSTMVKQIDATWSVGTAAGGLDTGTVAANTGYGVWLIARSDTGLVDALISTDMTASGSSVTMPTNYDRKRLIGWIRTDASSNIIGFTQVGDYFRLTGDIVQDLSDSTLVGDPTTFETVTLTTPPLSLNHIYAALNINDTSNKWALFYVRTTSASDSANVEEAFAYFENDSSVADKVSRSGQVLSDSLGRIDYAANFSSGTPVITIRIIGITMLTRSNP